ncbi:MAG TPA: hypothetical protein V6D06_11845 [Trichocoleus sp.]
MEYWEFLLQKEGDQAWLPLESSQVEILEGRYRIMAHTSAVDSPVRVRISHLLGDQTSPRRRVMKRSGQTNNTGLMVVMPFTWLKAGLWEVHCADGSSSEAHPTWQYAIGLQVLPQDTSESDEWFPEDWPTAPDRDAAARAAAEQMMPPLSEAVLAATFDAIDQALAEAVVSGEESTAQGLGLSTSYRLELAQSALMVNQGQVLMVVGQVKADNPAALQKSPTVPEGGVLALRLLDPQSASVIVTLQHALMPQPLPAAFAVPVALPEDLRTRLLLGELVLAVPTETAARILAVQRFTVTVDLAALFDAIANQAETEADFDIVFPPDAGAAADETLKNIAGTEIEIPEIADASLPEPPPRAMPTLLLPRSGLTLPPKIYYPTPHEAATHKPQLPPLAKAAPDGSAPPPASADEPSPEAAPAAPAAPSNSPPAVQLPSFVKPVRSAGPPAAEPPAPEPAAPEPPSPIDNEFRTLNLQERFWSRLNTLAVEAHEAAVSRQAAAPATEFAPPDDPWVEGADAVGLDDPEALGQSPPAPFAGEVVIYDDPDPVPPRGTVQAAPEADPAIVSADDEILSPPTPMLELPEGELLAGEKVSVRLRLPIHPNRVYLKVWITDPQTRTLADEPRQLTHLTPDGRGNLEGTLQLVVPQGCLEAWFEAIAVDMVTQQESYKASVSRAVVPPEVSSTSLDEFEL